MRPQARTLRISLRAKSVTYVFGINRNGYLTGQTMVQVLKQCGDELTLENVMRQAANLKNFELGMLLPGIKINTSPSDYFPIEQMQMSRFTGEHGELFGPMIGGEIGTQKP
jgi:branched-chain amino acid transport system substrate-binding protein